MPAAHISVSASIPVMPPADPAAPVPPPRPVRQPTKFFIVHDGENAYIPPDSRKFAQIFSDTYKEIVRVLCGEEASESFKVLGTIPPENRVWNYVMPSLAREMSEAEVAFLSRFRPRPEVMTSLTSVFNVYHLTATNKPGNVDVIVRNKLGEFLAGHRDLPRKRKDEWVVVLLSGDRDFSGSIHDLRGAGFRVVMIHPGNATGDMASIVDGSSARWKEIAGGTFRSRTPPPPSLDHQVYLSDLPSDVEDSEVRRFCEGTHPSVLV